LKYSRRLIKAQWKLSWGTTCFKRIGISVDVDLIQLCDLNLSDKIESFKKCIARWKRGYLTVIGKITVITSLVSPC